MEFDVICVGYPIILIASRCCNNRSSQAPFAFMLADASAKPPQLSLSLPWKSRITLSVLSTITDASCRKNGTVNRHILTLIDFQNSQNSKSINGIASHDVVVDQNHKLWLRVYAPTQHVDEDLSVVLFFHRGGFVFLSVDALPYDAVCRRFARKVPTVVVSVNYRRKMMIASMCSYFSMMKKV